MAVSSNPNDIELAEGLGNANGAAALAVGVFVLNVWGTFSSNTAKLQVSPDGGTTWLDYNGASFTAAGMLAPVYLGDGNPVRLTNTGGSINATLSPVL